MCLNYLLQKYRNILQNFPTFLLLLLFLFYCKGFLFLVLKISEQKSVVFEVQSCAILMDDGAHSVTPAVLFLHPTTILTQQLLTFSFLQTKLTQDSSECYMQYDLSNYHQITGIICAKAVFQLFCLGLCLVFRTVLSSSLNQLLNVTSQSVTEVYKVCSICGFNMLIGNDMSCTVSSSHNTWLTINSRSSVFAEEISRYFK